MKIFFRLIVTLVGIILIWIAMVLGASELTGEVVTLLRPEEDGTTKKVRLWIVDVDDKTWVEHGTQDSFWIKQNCQQDSSLAKSNCSPQLAGVFVKLDLI